METDDRGVDCDCGCGGSCPAVPEDWRVRGMVACPNRAEYRMVYRRNRPGRLFQDAVFCAGCVAFRRSRPGEWDVVSVTSL